MTDRTPSYLETEIADLAKRLYGLDGEISLLASFEDQNARVTTPSGSFVLKIFNTRWAIDGLHMQTEAFEYLAAVAPDLNPPRVVPARDGEAIAMVDGFAVRLLTYIPGEPFGDAPMSPELYRGLGRYMGRFTRAMQGFSHPAADRPDDLWNLDNVMACERYLPDIVDPDDRARIARYLSGYENTVRPRLEYLSKSVMHHDANDQNLLVSPDDPTRIAGLIDFGDMAYGTTINELAITLAYALFGVDDHAAAARQIVGAYGEEFPLESGELDVLFDLVAMRLAQSLLLTSHRAKQFPGNAYIPISQKPARALLKKLETTRGL